MAVPLKLAVGRERDGAVGVDDGRADLVSAGDRDGRDGQRVAVDVGVVGEHVDGHGRVLVGGGGVVDRHRRVVDGRHGDVDGGGVDAAAVPSVRV